MAWVKEKLERNRLHEMRARSGDGLGLFEYDGSVWLRLTDEAGDDLLRVYNLTDQQLTDLHAQIGGRLRLAPIATIDHLRRLHALLGDILGADRAAEEEQALAAWAAAGYGLPAGGPGLPADGSSDPGSPDAEPGAAADRGRM